MMNTERHMAMLKRIVNEYMHPHEGRTESSFEDSELGALRARVREIVNASPLAGEIDVLVGFDAMTGRICVAHVPASRGRA